MLKKYNLVHFTIVTISFLFIFTSTLNGQRHNRGNFEANGQIEGTIEDEQSGKAMEYVTVSVYNIKNDELVTGAVSDTKGHFIINKLAYGRYRLEINFMGYTTQTKDDIKLFPRQSSINIGRIIMVPDQTVLSTIEVVDRANQVRYELDKKVIDVSKMASAASESAIEILETIPSITIDIEGNIALRGSQNFRLLIDGQPTNLTASDLLASIPASSIQNIEIITNPSAKYDAEGTGGLINIVLKKNTLQGISAIINASVGTFENYSTDAQVQMNKNRLSLQLGGKYRDSNSPSTLTSVRRTTRNNNTSNVDAFGDHSRDHGIKSIQGVLGYKIHPNHNIRLDGSIMAFTMNASLDLEFIEKLNDQVILQSTTLENTTRDFMRSKWGLNYEYFIHGDKKHFIQGKIFKSLFDGDELATTYFILDGQENPYDGKQSSEIGPSNLTRYNLDYSKTFKGGSRLELGGLAQFGRSEDNNKSLTYNTGSESFLPIDSLDTDAIYFRDIFAVYSTFGSEFKKLKYQFGIRVEKTLRNVKVNESFTDTKIDRLDFFPSLHLSYELSKKTKFIGSYSKRINRPRSYWLEPFFSWRDAYNIRQGNPDLQPEYIDSYELGFIQDLPKGYFSSELYHRTTSNLITRVKSVYTDNTFLTRPENVGTEYSTGLETSVSYKFFKKWNSTLSMNVFKYRISGLLNDNDINDESFSWTLRWDNRINFKKGWKLQLTSMYDSPIVQAQGERSETYSVNGSIKKTLFDSKLSFNLQVRDIFSTQLRESYEEGSSFYYYNKRNPRSPKVSLAVSFKINNYKERRERTQDSDEF